MFLSKYVLLVNIVAIYIKCHLIIWFFVTYFSEWHYSILISTCLVFPISLIYISVKPLEPINLLDVFKPSRPNLEEFNPQKPMTVLMNMIIAIVGRRR